MAITDRAALLAPYVERLMSDKDLQDRVRGVLRPDRDAAQRSRLRAAAGAAASLGRAGRRSPKASSDAQGEYEQLRRDIQEIRSQLGATFEALLEKSDIKDRAQQRIIPLKDAAQTDNDGTTPSGQQIVPSSRRSTRPLRAAGVLLAAAGVAWLRGRRS